MTSSPTRTVSDADRAQLTPVSLLDMNYAFARTAVLLAGVRLRLFTHLAGKALTAHELAMAAGTRPGPTERFLNVLVALGLVERSGETYRLAAMADLFLVEGKPTYLGGDTLAMVDYLPAWLELHHTIAVGEPYRDLGTPATAAAFFAPRVRDLFPLVYPIAVRMALALNITASTTDLQVLDVGAGSGAWSAAIAQRYLCAQITAIDLPEVVAEGRRQIEELGLADRYVWAAADALTEPLPPNTYHLALVAHLCRFIGERRSRELFRRLYSSLRPGGTLVVADVLPLDDRSGPLFTLMLDLSMLVNTAEGRTFTFQEFATWLNEAAFQEVHQLDVAAPSPLIVARKGGTCS
jgi:ubiquinone/menaquinone biosynthesis C-methylase UbiE